MKEFLLSNALSEKNAVESVSYPIRRRSLSAYFEYSGLQKVIMLKRSMILFLTTAVEIPTAATPANSKLKMTVSPVFALSPEEDEGFNSAISADAPSIILA